MIKQFYIYNFYFIKRKKESQIKLCYADNAGS